TILLLSVFTLSCTSTTFYPLGYARALGKSRPLLEGTPRKIEMDTHFASVYANGVFMRAKSGAIYPLEIVVYDINKDGAFDTVYIRPGGPDSWKVFHNLPP